MTNKIIYLFIFSMLCLTTGIKAQTDSTKGSSIEVELLTIEDLIKLGINIDSFGEKNIMNTASTVAVVDRKTIERFNFLTISEALNFVSGFSVIRTYLKRNLPTSRGVLQDNYANKVLVLLNGIPVWHGGTGESSLDRVAISDVERLEVLKGPASVLYGTNAYSGAINIVLKKSTDLKISSTARVGENGLIGTGSNISYSSEDFSVFASANSNSEIGSDYRFNDQSKITGWVKQYIKGDNFTANLGYKKHSFLVNRYVVDESFLGVTPKFSAGAGKNHSLNGYLFNYGFSLEKGKEFKLNLNATYDWEQRQFARSLDDNTRTDIVGERIAGVANAYYSPSEVLSFQLGAEYAIKKSIKYDNIDVQKSIVLEDNYMKNKSVYDVSVFGQADIYFNPADFVVGMRYNKNELFGGNLSTRGTFVYQLNEKNSIKLMYGTSYRSPSLFELYFRTSTNTVFGNTKLIPEKSESIELAYLTSFDNIFIQALVYYAGYKNKIYRTTGSYTLEDGTVKQNVSYYTNGNNFTAKGIELDLKYQLSDQLNIIANYSYVSGDNGDEINSNGNYNFKFVPQHSFVAGVYKQFGIINCSAMYKFISETGSVFNTIGSQGQLDISIGVSHKIAYLNVSQNLVVKNLFNRTILFPEYVSRVLNDVPSGFGRVIAYVVSVEM